MCIRDSPRRSLQWVLEPADRSIKTAYQPIRKTRGRPPSIARDITGNGGPTPSSHQGPAGDVNEVQHARDHWTFRNYRNGGCRTQSTRILHSSGSTSNCFVWHCSSQGKYCDRDRIEVTKLPLLSRAKSPCNWFGPHMALRAPCRIYTHSRNIPSGIAECAIHKSWLTPLAVLVSFCLVGLTLTATAEGVRLKARMVGAVIPVVVLISVAAFVNWGPLWYPYVALALYCYLLILRTEESHPWNARRLAGWLGMDVEVVVALIGTRAGASRRSFAASLENY